MTLPVTDYSIKELKRKIEKGIAYCHDVGETNENWIVLHHLRNFKILHNATVNEVDDILRQIDLEYYIPINHIQI